jgi:ABC-type nitrate/sulfonate/bicarbonate transport system substrate-binding protein
MNTASRRAGIIALAATAALALASCASTPPPATTDDSSDNPFRLPETTHVRVLLDYFVYGAHAGIYEALEQGFYEENNIDLEVIVPNDPVASLKFVQAGQADIGIASPLDLVSLVSQDSEYTTFMSLVGGNLEGMAVLASSGIESAGDLGGLKVGTSGSVSHNAMADEMISSSGGDPSESEYITVGSGFMQYLIDGQVDAVMAFKPDVAAAEAAGEDVSFIPLGQDGGLAFPSVVVYAGNDYIADNEDVVAAFTDATIRGYEALLDNPEEAAQATVDANAGLEVDSMLSQVEGIGDSFIGPNASFGLVDADALQGLADFMLDNGFIDKAVSADDFVRTDIASDR